MWVAGPSEPGFWCWTLFAVLLIPGLMIPLPSRTHRRSYLPAHLPRSQFLFLHALSLPTKTPPPSTGVILVPGKGLCMRSRAGSMNRLNSRRSSPRAFSSKSAPISSTCAPSFTGRLPYSLPCPYCSAGARASAT